MNYYLQTLPIVVPNNSLCNYSLVDEIFLESVSLVIGSASHKAQIRAIAYHIVCDTQPIANLRALNYLQAELLLGAMTKRVGLPTR